MSSKVRLSEYIFRRKWFFLALIPVLAAAVIVAAYIGMTETPIGSINISPASDSGWTYTLRDGTEIKPDAAGNLPLPDASTTVYCTRALADHSDEITASALLVLNTRICDVAVLVGDELIADPTHRYNEADGSFAEAQVKTTGGGMFSLGIVDELTLAVKFLNGTASVATLPSVEVFSSASAYYNQWMAPTAEAALPAGVFLAAAVLLIGLFLFQLYHEKANWGFLLLSLLALTFGLLQTVSYSASVIWFLQSPIITWGIQVMPTIIVLWVLWYHTNGGVKKFGWILPLVCTLCVVGGIVYRHIDLAAGAKWTNLLQGKILPLVLLASLLVCAWQAVRKNAYYRRFFVCGGSLAVCTGVLTLISYLRDGAWWQNLQTTAQNVSLLGSYFQPMQLVNKFLLLLFFLLAVYDFTMSIVRRNAELQALTLQNRYTAEHAAHLRRSLDETHELRHEMRHHINALKALCKEGDIGRVGNYLDSMGGTVIDAPSRYTDHALINALVSSCAQQAETLGADFEAAVLVPEKIGMEDTDIAVLLSNMIDNALEALTDVPSDTRRVLQLKVETVEDGGLFVSCSNTYTGVLKRSEDGELCSTKSGEGHGLGLKAMRRVAEKYNSVLLIEPEGDLFCVTTYLYFHK